LAERFTTIGEEVERIAETGAREEALFSVLGSLVQRLSAMSSWRALQHQGNRASDTISLLAISVGPALQSLLAEAPDRHEVRADLDVGEVLALVVGISAVGDSDHKRVAVVGCYVRDPDCRIIEVDQSHRDFLEEHLSTDLLEP
jgi:hypothetical protein